MDSRRRLATSLTIVGIVLIPALLLRLTNARTPAPVALVIFGAAVVGAAFLLAWAAEAAQFDISGGLAIAILAVIAVLPEYAVDLYFAYTAGHEPSYAAYAAANMTGSNRLLMGLGWPVIVLLGLMASRRSGNPLKALPIDSSSRIELGFLLIAGVAAVIAPLTADISLILAVALIGWFAFYLYRVARAEVEEPELVGTAGAIGSLPTRRRRVVTIALFAIAAGMIMFCAEPFAESLIASGSSLGVDEFLLVQWLAPLASEAPEFIVAILFAVRGNASGALAMLISAKVNQWTLLVGSLPVAYVVGGGAATGLPLDPRQVEEMWLTAAQTLMGVSLILALRFPRWAAWTLLGLFAVQFAIPGTTGRLVVAGVYALLAIAGFVVNRQHVLPTLRAPFRPAALLHGAGRQ